MVLFYVLDSMAMDKMLLPPRPAIPLYAARRPSLSSQAPHPAVSFYAARYPTAPLYIARCPAMPLPVGPAVILYALRCPAISLPYRRLAVSLPTTSHGGGCTTPGALPGKAAAVPSFGAPGTHAAAGARAGAAAP